MGGRASTWTCDVVRLEGEGTRREVDDTLAVEEPLEIRIAWRHLLEKTEKSLSVTMRTPGDDVELATGFVFTEGIVRAREQIAKVAHCGPAVRDDGTSNVVKIELAEGVHPDVARLERHFYTTSSCGVCGKTSLDAVRTTAASPRLDAAASALRVRAATVHALPAALRAAQATFDRTGGLHGAGLFDADGRLLLAREDVGRHNAVDKLVGAQLAAGALPASSTVLLVSGRASFELVQKAFMAGVPVMVAVGAPSSLAVELARDVGMTLVGFARDARFNVYATPERITS